MKRIAMIALGLAGSLVLAACGGGGTTATPDNNDNHQAIDVQGAGGSRTVSFVPGKLNVHFGGSAADLEQAVARFGYSVEFTTGNYASVDIGGADPQAAITALDKEYCVFSAEQVQQVAIKATGDRVDIANRTASFTPLDPYYGDRFVGLGTDTDGAFTLAFFFGQAWPMNSMGFNGAWDISDPLNVNGQVAAQPVRIAIIDAGWFDYSTLDRDGFDETVLDNATSGSITGSGTFTAGLAAVEWDTTVVNSDTIYYRSPYRITGEALLGILAADVNNIKINGRDFSGDTTLTSDELWNEGMAGINPNASITLIKTGTADTGNNTWNFSDQEIAAAINRAWNEADCDIILLGMFIDGAVPANVQTAITNARANGALVIAPAGDVVDSFDTGAFTDTPVDITTNPVWPAAATDCLSVTGTGYNRIGSLPDVTIGGNPVENIGTGWTPTYNAPFDQTFTAVTNYCNTGADIAAMAWGFGFGPSPYFVQDGVGDGTQGNPYELDLSEQYNTNSVARFSTTYSAAYVAGAASIVFQGLSFANGTAPTPAEVESSLFDTVQFGGMAGILNNGGYLNANKAMADAISGGSLFQYEPAMTFTGNLNTWFSQQRAAVNRGADLSVSPTIVNGTAPFMLTVDWSNGEEPVEVANWDSGDALTLTGGYDTLGSKTILITVKDANDQTVSIPPEVYVINPLSASISIENAAGATMTTTLKKSTNYRFKSNVTNAFTGDIGGVPNTTTFNWWFSSDPASDPADATGPNPTFSFSAAGSYTVTLRVNEDVRPDSTFTLNVTVTP
jgi:hypothetical protein